MISTSFSCPISSGRLHGCRRGRGTPLVFCHGIPGNSEVWGDLSDDLAQDHLVIEYERLGYGRSETCARRERRFLEQHSDDLIEMLDVLGYEKVVIVGWSVGAAIAQLTAQRHGGRVSALVLLAPVGPRYEAPRPMFLEALAGTSFGFALVSALLAVSPIKRALVRSGLAEGFAPQPVPERWLSVFAGLYGDRPSVRTALDESQALRHASLSELGICAPALIMHGTSDQIIPVAISKALARDAPDATLVAVSGHGHALHLSCPELCAREIRAFLAVKMTAVSGLVSRIGDSTL
jgi:pimeloyl-ACP methyl ester carboxylesterase